MSNIMRYEPQGLLYADYAPAFPEQMQMTKPINYEVPFQLDPIKEDYDNTTTTTTSHRTRTWIIVIIVILILIIIAVVVIYILHRKKVVNLQKVPGYNTVFGATKPVVESGYKPV